jgi:hypothetical protein
MKSCDDLQGGQGRSKCPKLCDLSAKVGRFLITKHPDFMRRRSTALSRRDALHSCANKIECVDVTLHRPERASLTQSLSRLRIKVSKFLL